MADSPLRGAEQVVRVSITSNGTPLPDSVALVSLEVERGVNRIPSARLSFADGDMPGQCFPVSDGELLVPGAEIVIQAGYGDSEQALFSGIVVRHGLRVAGDNQARLVVDCRDKAVRMTLGRRNANYVDQSDSDIISALIGRHGLAADVAATRVAQPELVQYYATDWDFMLTRAEANGLLVITRDGQLAVKPPDTASAPVLSVGYGIDLIEFDADLDAGSQLAAAQAVAWDPKNQAALQGASAAPATLAAQGNLDGATLAQVLGLDSLRLQSGAALAKDALDAWAQAQQLKAALARLRGRMRFQGSALAEVGKLIELTGAGARFSGQVFVSALRHEIADGQWTTEARFGLAPDWFAERPDVVAPPAAGLLPGIEGLQVGKVLKLDADPGGEQRVQVALPVMQAETEGVWARLLQPYASNGFGAFWLPEVGDEVVLGFFGHDPGHPVLLGSLYSSQRPPPYALAAENNTKAWVTRCKHRVVFDEDKKIITITTPAANQLVFSDDGKSILLQDQNGNKIELAEGGITLTSPKDIKLSAQGQIKLDAVGNIGLTAQADVKSSGLNVACEAQVGFSAKGNAQAELSASGQTTVKGALVMIN